MTSHLSLSPLAFDTRVAFNTREKRGLQIGDPSANGVRVEARRDGAATDGGAAAALNTTATVAKAATAATATATATAETATAMAASVNAAAATTAHGYGECVISSAAELTDTLDRAQHVMARSISQLERLLVQAGASVSTIMSCLRIGCARRVSLSC
eukprot:6213600-Pleurochrysis_carterae.AAC.2